MTERAAYAKLYHSVTKAYVCKQLSRVVMKMEQAKVEPSTADSESDALTITLPRHFHRRYFSSSDWQRERVSMWLVQVVLGQRTGDIKRLSTADVLRCRTDAVALLGRRRTPTLRQSAALWTWWTVPLSAACRHRKTASSRWEFCFGLFDTC